MPRRKSPPSSSRLYATTRKTPTGTSNAIQGSNVTAPTTPMAHAPPIERTASPVRIEPGIPVPSGRPLRAGTSVIDIVGGMFGAFGTVLALKQRDKTGKGGLVESALFESVVFLMGQHLAITAINGAALGSGLAMVASSDILICSDKASLGLPEVDVGLLGGCRHAMRLFSHSRLRRMMLTGYRVTGPELLRLGIVEDCTTPEELMPAAMALATTIASKSPISTRMGKHTLNVIEDMSLRDGYRYEQDMTAIIGKTDDAKEAQLAFKEKRAAVFTGR